MAMIQAGTYRFHDALSGIGQESFAEAMDFTIETTLPYNGVHHVINCSACRLGWHLNGGNDTDSFYVVVVAESATPALSALGLILPDAITLYDDGNEAYWATDLFGTGIQTIRIPTEQAVSDAFYAWFTANTVEVGKVNTVAAIQYGNSKITELFPGQTATLKCAGMKMGSDVVVEIGKHAAYTIGIVDVRIEEV